jgi:hypothetical protein
VTHASTPGWPRSRSSCRGDRDTVLSKAFAANIDVIGLVTRKGDAYFTPPAVEGKHPLLSIEVSMALGQLTIRAT